MTRVDRDVYVDLQVRQKYNTWLPSHWQHVLLVFQVEPRLNTIKLRWSWNAIKVPLKLKKAILTTHWTHWNVLRDSFLGPDP